jgi:hypothetical protein
VRIYTTRASGLAFSFKAGVISAFLATTASALSIAVLNALPVGPGSSQTSGPGLLDILRAALLLCAITVVSCGSFGFLAGIAGSQWLLLRKRRIHSTKRQLVESGLTGFFLGALFPWFDGFVSWHRFGFGIGGMSLIQLILCPLAGLACALVCALVFRKHLVAERVSHFQT